MNVESDEVVMSDVETQNVISKLRCAKFLCANKCQICAWKKTRLKKKQMCAKTYLKR